MKASCASPLRFRAALSGIRVFPAPALPPGRHRRCSRQKERPENRRAKRQRMGAISAGSSAVPAGGTPSAVPADEIWRSRRWLRSERRRKPSGTTPAEPPPLQRAAIQGGQTSAAPLLHDPGLPIKRWRRANVPLRHRWMTAGRRPRSRNARDRRFKKPAGSFVLQQGGPKDRANERVLIVRKPPRKSGCGSHPS